MAAPQGWTARNQEAGPAVVWTGWGAETRFRRLGNRTILQLKNTVFIHTNRKQMFGAIVSRHALRRQSAAPDAFDVRIVSREDFPFFRDYEGRKFLRGGNWRVWENNDLQSFTPIRFSAPELMGYDGRAIVIDPDVFAVADINHLFQFNMEGKAILAKARPGHKGRENYIATSVMLLDCARLTHWNLRRQFVAMFEGKLDYQDWIELRNEPEDTIGHLDSVWNDFDRLAPDTRMLHNTKRRTQPWKTGLPIDFISRPPWYLRFLPITGYRRRGAYRPHPDPRQERFFFALVRECLATGEISEDFLAAEMASNHLRHDAPELIERAPSVDQVLAEVRAA